MDRRSQIATCPFAKTRQYKSLLEIAVETGFHSMVELIAKNETAQDPKNSALGEAVAMRRLDLCDLLHANGAEINSVPFVDVLLTWEPNLIRFFLDRGADPVNGRPFAEAFRSKIRTALRAFLDCKRAHPELVEQLQQQLDCALRYFCGEGDLKWVSLLIWAGGDPRSRGPCLGKDYIEDPEGYTSGLEEACRSENLDVLKKLKPDPKRDKFRRASSRCSHLGSEGHARVPARACPPVPERNARCLISARKLNIAMAPPRMQCQ